MKKTIAKFNRLRKFSIDQWLLILIGLTWSWGQLGRWQLNEQMVFYPHDFLILLYLLRHYRLVIAKLRILWRQKRPWPALFIIWLILGWLNQGHFLPAILSALAYFCRFSTYLLWGYVLFNQRLKIFANSQTWWLWLSFLVVVLGLGQYLIFPDLRWLAVFGWDDHYYRLAYPFFDPAFTGLILVFLYLAGLNFSTYRARFLNCLLIINLALTFSRSSYLAFAISGLVVWLLSKQKKLLGRRLLLAAMILLATIFLAPKPGGEGVNLARKSTIVARQQNWFVYNNLNWPQSCWGHGWFVHFENEKKMPIAAHNRQPDNIFLGWYWQGGFIGLTLLFFILLKMPLYFWRQKNHVLLALLVAWFVHSQFNASWSQPFVLILFILMINLFNQK